MGYYHIKNIKMDKKNNTISADLADSNWYPIEFYHTDCLCKGDSFEEKYANFIYNVVAGNYHPSTSNKYSKIMMNHWLQNYYDDASDMGMLETYNKYKDVVNGILNNIPNKIVRLESDRELNPEKYYILRPIELNVKYEGDYYCNQKGELYNYTKENGLLYCEGREVSTFGKPYYKPNDIDKFIKYNDFLFELNSEESLVID